MAKKKAKATRRRKVQVKDLKPRKAVKGGITTEEFPFLVTKLRTP